MHSKIVLLYQNLVLCIFFTFCILSSVSVLCPFIAYIVCSCIYVYVKMFKGPNGRLANEARCAILLTNV